jgi:hypothetical protein
MKRPEGSVKLSGLRPLEGQSDARLQVVAGAHVFRVSREAVGAYTALHGCPGVGTRVARIPAQDAPGEQHPDVWVTWSPEALHLYVVPSADPSGMVSAEGVSSDVQLWVDIQGGVTEVGGGAKGVSAWAGSQPLLGPPAIDLWNLTLQAVDTLMGGQSDSGFMFDVVVANAALSMLVTGLEAYSEARFVELEGEGLPLNGEGVVQKLGTKEERDQLKAGVVPEVLSVPGSASELARALSERFSFQNFDRSKTLFGRGYGLRFSEDLGLLQRVKTLLGYRHRVIHVSPLVAILNRRDAPPQELEFSGREFAQRTRGEFDQFVLALHAASLRLRPPPSVRA